MQRTGTVPIAMCFWPGLTRLWFRGQWSALATAICFACLLNFGLVFSFVWSEAVHPHVCLMVWSGTGLLWMLSGWRQFRERETLLVVDVDSTTSHDPLLFEAQCEYLAGRMDDSVNLLERILFSDPRDVEARLLLATIMRRQKRFEEAEEQLEVIRKYDGAVKWSDEIEKEVEQLHRDEAEAEEKLHKSELQDDSSGTAIPEKPELATIESRQRVDSDEVPESIDTSQTRSDSVAGVTTRSTKSEESLERGKRLSISERFALQVSEISVATRSDQVGSASRKPNSKRKDAA